MNLQKIIYSLKDIESPHSINVAKISEKIAWAMNLYKDEIKKIRIAGFFHDIGKVFINPQIINKMGKLTYKEWEEMKKHPLIGYEILSSNNGYADIARYVLQHHERWDGTGYPNKLKADKILLPARIISVADAFDAMVSQRCYKEAYSIEKAIEEINLNAGKQFDPIVVDVFTNMYTNMPHSIICQYI